MRRAVFSVLLLTISPCACRERRDAPLPLTDAEWKQYVEFPEYSQPTFKRVDYTHPNSNAHLLLQRAAELHQQGDLDKAVQVLKNILQKVDTNYHGEAYAALAKVLNDQGKFDLADRSMAKSNRVYNEGLAQWTLF